MKTLLSFRQLFVCTLVLCISIGSTTNTQTEKDLEHANLSTTNQPLTRLDSCMNDTDPDPNARCLGPGSMASTAAAPYKHSPLTAHFGRIIQGINLEESLSDQVINAIKNDLHEHRLLLFRRQGRLSAETQLKVSRWFGEVESTFSRHPRSPDPDIFRVSNDPREGCTQVGRSGWHIDGTFMRCPFKVQTMHFWSVSKGGSTQFSPLNEVVKGLSEEERKVYGDLYFLSDNGLIKPVVYPHPVTRKDTMVFHCGGPFVKAFLKGYDPSTNQAERIYGHLETKKVLSEITAKLEDPKVMLEMEWEEGDFAIVDNLAVAHYAVPETQKQVHEAGLRILHRTTVAGDYEPQKQPS